MNVQNILRGKFVNPSDKEMQNDSFDIVFDSVGLEVSRQQSISVIKPGGTIIHIGLTNLQDSLILEKQLFKR